MVRVLGNEGAFGEGGGGGETSSMKGSRKLMR